MYVFFASYIHTAQKSPLNYDWQLRASVKAETLPAKGHSQLRCSANKAGIKSQLRALLPPLLQTSSHAMANDTSHSATKTVQVSYAEELKEMGGLAVHQQGSQPTP